MTNIAVLQGRITREPEIRELTGGKKKVDFTLAVDRMNDKTDFIRCVAWERTAEAIATYVRKGQMIVVTGRISSETWEDKEGNKREATRVIINEFSFCGSKKTEEKPVHFEELPDDGDLPF